MNKIFLLGRLTQNPEVRYSQAAESTCIARYTLAVNRRYKREGEPDADFIRCVAFGKSGEFVSKYFKKGQQISVIGRLQIRSYDDKNGQRQWITEVIAEEHYFADSKRQETSVNQQANNHTHAIGNGIDEVVHIDDVEDLPF